MRKIIYATFCVMMLITIQGVVSIDLNESKENIDISNQGEITDISFYQLNFNLNGVETENSNWGVAELTFVGSNDILYLNLNAYEIWGIKNVPVISVMGSSDEQTQRFWFPLPTEIGEDIGFIYYGISLTEDILETPPSITDERPIEDDEYIVFDAALDFDMITEITGAVPVEGSAAIEPEQHRNLNFPNQQAGPGECAPTAVSNSLQFLNDAHNMGLNTSNLTIEKMKEACNFNTTASPGCWIFHDDSRDEGQRNAWYEDKNNYMQENNINVSTRRFNKSDIGRIADEMDEDQDIEMEIGGHTVSVVGITEQEDGNFSVTIAHDKNQHNDSEGTVVETGIWNSTNGWSGALAPYGTNLNYFIVECPIEQEEPNRPPEAPSRPSGETSGSPGNSYTYSTSCVDPDGDRVQIIFSWGDGTDSGWEGPYDSGEIVEIENTWHEKGDYQVKVKARDVPELKESDWSEPLVVSMPKNKQYVNSMLFRFLRSHPYLFPILKQLIKI